MGDAIKEAVVKLSVEQEVARIKAPSTDPITKWKNAQVAAHRDVIRSATAAERSIQRELDRTAAKLERNIALYRTMASAAATTRTGVPTPAGRGRRRSGRASGIAGGLMDLGAGFGGFGGMGGGYGGLNPVEMVRDFFGGMSNREYARTMGRARTAGRFALGSLATPAMGAIAGAGTAAISAAYIVNREATAGLDDWNRRNLWRPEGAPIPEVASRPSSRAVAMLGRFRAPAGQQYVTNADNERLRRMYAAISEREMARDEASFRMGLDLPSVSYSGYGANGRQRLRAASRAARLHRSGHINPRRLAFEQSEAGDGSGFADRHIRRVNDQISLRQEYLGILDDQSQAAVSNYNERIGAIGVTERNIVGAQRDVAAAEQRFNAARRRVAGSQAGIGLASTRDKIELRRITGAISRGRRLNEQDLNALYGIAGTDERVAAYVEREGRRLFKEGGFGGELDAAFGRERPSIRRARDELNAARANLDAATEGDNADKKLESLARQRDELLSDLQTLQKELSEEFRTILGELRQLKIQANTIGNAVGQ